MKKLYLLLALCACACNSSTESGSTGERPQEEPDSAHSPEIPCEMPVGNLEEVDLEWQWYELSCWAASLSMAAKYIQPKADSLDQCYFVHLKNDLNACRCKTYQIVSNEVRYGYVPLQNSLGNCDNSDDYDDTYGSNLPERLSYAKFISNNADTLKRALPIQFLKANLDAGLPVIHTYSVGNSSAHVNLLAKGQILNVANGGNSNIQLVEVKDPWPQGAGSEYFITYEQFYLDKGQDNIFFGKRCPVLLKPSPTEAYLQNSFVQIHPSAKDLVNKFTNEFVQADRIGLEDKFLKKLGLTPGFTQLQVSPIYFKVVRLGDEVIRDGEFLTVNALSNIYQFDQEMYFLLDETRQIKTAVTCSKMGDGTASDNNYINKWFLSTFENAARFKNAINMARRRPRGIQDLVLFKIEGKRNFEILARKTDTNGRFRIIEAIRQDRKSLEIIIE